MDEESLAGLVISNCAARSRYAIADKSTSGKVACYTHRKKIINVIISTMIVL